jgi:hypothetical protein
MGSVLFVWGGQNPLDNTVLDDGATYDPKTDRWTTLVEARYPSARSGGLVVWTGKEVIVWGGSFGSGGEPSTNLGGRYSLQLGRWLPTTMTSAPSARDYAVGVWTGRSFFVWGGANASGDLADGALYGPP